ncbi:MAG: prepilin-type N-terminal cleavage/methylation domain-containing protein [Desulfobacteraceae bacterium]|nr:MAG: prepilin-type N-terminal cleavage/methylation domain-containing protein [Desulfobacteraceae bacterium]
METHMTDQKGFTLIELMIVISIIGILAAIAIPQFSAYRARACHSEAFELADDVRKNIKEYYEHTGLFPKNNEQAGVAAPELIKGKYVDRIEVVGGVIHVYFNKETFEKYGKKERVLQPAIIKDNPTGPIIWFLDAEIEKISPDLIKIGKSHQTPK